MAQQPQNTENSYQSERVEVPPTSEYEQRPISIAHNQGSIDHTSSTNSQFRTKQSTSLASNHTTTKKRNGSNKRGESNVHIVKSGDSLSKIAKTYYHRESDWTIIARANSLTKRSVLRLGQRLVIPPGKDTPSRRMVVSHKKKSSGERSLRKRSSTKKSPTREFSDRYTVRKGDSLSKIAKTFDVRVARIYELNRKILGDNPHFLREGQLLRIPSRDLPMASMNK